MCDGRGMELEKDQRWSQIKETLFFTKNKIFSIICLKKHKLNFMLNGKRKTQKKNEENHLFLQTNLSEWNHAKVHL